jgi:hypothetical protein
MNEDTKDSDNLTFWSAPGSALLWSVWWETPRVLLSRSPRHGPHRAVHLAAVPSEGDVQSLFHPVLGAMHAMPCRSLSQVLLGLEGIQAGEVVEHLLVLGQLECGVGSDDGFEVGGLGGVDGDHTCSQQ